MEKISSIGIEISYILFRQISVAEINGDNRLFLLKNFAALGLRHCDSPYGKSIVTQRASHEKRRTRFRVLEKCSGLINR